MTSERLDLSVYLQNPNHFTLQDWYLSNSSGFEDIRLIDIEKRWKIFCSEKGLLPFDDSISNDVHEDFYQNQIDRDLWVIISTKNIYYVDFHFRIVFMSAFLSELELHEGQMEEIFQHIYRGGAACFRYNNFPRRIDKFPMREPSIALLLFNRFSKDAKEQIQWEF